MATTANSRTSSDAASVPFSYAQAAKGLVVAPASSASKASSSGAATPAKDSQSASTSAAAVMSWAEDAEGNDARPEKGPASHESQTQSTKSVTAPSELTAAALASPEIGASTASTVTKDDDVSSIPNTSSDSTWENKSQASTSVEKSTETSEKSSQKGKGKKREQAPAKPLQEAPLPAVNIWQQRAELRKPVKPVSATSHPNGATNGHSASKQSKDESADAKAKNVPTENKARSTEEERAITRVETESDKARKHAKARPQDKDLKEASNAFSLPLDRDQESWPTMDAAIDEDRKKAQEKTEKSDKERKESTGAKAAGKGQWVKVPFVPSVNFNTPLPSSGARRGGRSSTTRGGAQNGARAGFGTSGPEKDTSSPAATANGEQPRRGRPDVSAREASPKENRPASTSSLVTKDKSAQVNGEKSKSASAEVDAQSKENGVLAESQNNSAGPNQHNNFPRQYPSNRSNKSKRADWSGSDRRKDTDPSVSKENGVHHDRTTQTDGPEDAERRQFAEGQAPYQSKRGAGDRFGSYNRGERRGGRGGGRGGNFSNGHQFANGHMSMKSASGFPGPMSPTTFNPEQSPYFPQSRYRNNGPRSQSVTNESMYRGSGQFAGSQHMPSLNTYTGGNGYDYPMMAPVSAAPFGQFGMDHFALFSMVTSQLEYYFSLDNLCKDMFLRKHMDSKGFVFLGFISDFNRIKHLTTDLELIKLVCYQSRAIEFRVGHDGKDRLRARENWQQWVLPVEERDPSAQNEGPEELYNPPIPHPNGFDPNGNPRYPDMSATSTAAPGGFSTEAPQPTANGFQPGASQHVAASSENTADNVSEEQVNGNATPNDHAVDDSTKAEKRGE